MALNLDCPSGLDITYDDLQVVVLALWEAQRANETDYPHTARKYGRLRNRLDAYLEASDWIKEVRKQKESHN